MGEIKHTPGPWECHPDDLAEGLYWVLPEATTVAEDEANAHLIAAAPEMKEALEALISVMETTECDRLFRADYAKAKAALAKANGERPPLPPTARCE